MTDLKFQKILSQGAFALFFVALFLLVNCNKNVESIKRDVAPAPPGTRVLSLTVENTDGTAIIDYTVAIVASSSALDTTYTSSTQTDIIPLTSDGIYTITVSKTGYIGQTKEATVQLPANISHDYTLEVTLFMTKSNPPVTIDNAAGGTIEVATNSTAGAGAATTSISIPPGAIPGGGATDISVTPIPPDHTAESGAEVSGTSFVFEPDGLQFEVPITVDIPLNMPQELLNAGVPVSFVYVTGAGVVTNEKVDVALSADGSKGAADITHFSAWKTVQGINISKTKRVVSKNFTGGCGSALNDTFSKTGTLGTIYSALFAIPATKRNITKSVAVSKAAVADVKYSATATMEVEDYVVTVNSNGIVLERGTAIPLGNGLVTYSTEGCHNSGGG